MALQPSPQWLDSGNNAWQLAAATFVGLQSIPGLTVLYGGIVKRKWAINSAFMAMYAFASVLVVWVLFAYNMSFGPQWFPFLGTPALATSAAFTTGQATIPAAAAGMPPLTFPMATLIFFQFVFAAITVIILAGSLLGRMNFTAWMIFCPVWVTLVYTVGAFSLWGGGWLASMGVADFSGGYVIHLAAGTSGFVAAAVIGPRIQPDRDHFPPNSLLVTLIGAGILWLGWAHLHLVEQCAFAMDKPGIEQRGPNRHVVLGCLHGLINRAHRVPDLITKVPKVMQNGFDDAFGLRRLFVREKKEQIDI